MIDPHFDIHPTPAGFVWRVIGEYGGTVAESVPYPSREDAESSLATSLSARFRPTTYTQPDVPDYTQLYDGLYADEPESCTGVKCQRVHGGAV